MKANIITMKTYCKLFALLAAAAAMAACNGETKEIKPIDADPNQLIFTVGGVDRIDTKANGYKATRIQTDRIALSEPGDPDQLFLIETVEDMDNNYYNTSVDTKGTPVYTETFANTYKTFSTLPYRGGARLTEGVKSPWSGLVQASENRYAFDFTDGWPGEDNILFFMAAPADLTKASDETLGYSNLTLDAADGKISFDYTSPALAAAGESGILTLEDASKLQDLLFTCKDVTKSEYRGAGSTILFYHTLAGVKFKSGNAVREGTTKQSSGREIAKITNITSVKFTNIRTSGHCELTPDQSYSNTDSNASASVPKSSAAAVWTNIDGTADFAINVRGVVNNEGQFAESTGFEGSNELGQKNLNSSNFDQTFMFVPQETGVEGDCILTIEYEIGPHKFSKMVNFGKRKWEAGKLYTYTLSANHVAVSIVDDLVANSAGVENQVKKNVRIKNTGNIDEYMRIAIVGNWYDSHSYNTDGHDQIVCAWDPEDLEQGEFVGWNDLWIKGDDGFYYYKYKVAAQQYIDVPPFVSYTVGKCPFNLYGTMAHLELDIIVQAIDATWKDGGTKENKMVNYGWNMDKYVTSYHPNYNPGTTTE